ncbi:hypothetical protein PILCRDRAFT_14546 [Piloderma croceum F 1598]|uniref:Uncharacterized protein n=1 Tax=Piloderma croceum (strain F 1598) TaxID=765440 RepID=A0A0C3F2I5_PILCF|nr:hypothetical protein PILCRDRAFT_14546 [Piloderma croceum F 1598]
MDYSICQALKRFPHHVQALIIYDICCQWSLHFRQRVSESKFLELFDSLEIIGAVGKWHLAAHILECFPKFSLNFVEGAGEVDGEILETLWSPLDEVAGLTQAMSIPHAQEVIDDHMNDSNWQKIISDSLCTKRSQAMKGVSEMKPAFEQLTKCLDASLVRGWTEQERVAMEQCGDHLKIYEVVAKKLPTLVEIQLKLSETEVQHRNLSSSVSTIMEDLAIEKLQMLLQRHVASLGSTCSVAQKNELLDRRCKLEARISTYEHKVSVIIKLNDDVRWATQDGRTLGMDPEAGEASDDLLALYPDEWFTPEKERITLPSALTAGKIDHLALKPIAND